MTTITTKSGYKVILEDKRLIIIRPSDMRSHLFFNLQLGGIEIFEVLGDDEIEFINLNTLDLDKLDELISNFENNQKYRDEPHLSLLGFLESPESIKKRTAVNEMWKSEEKLEFYKDIYPDKYKFILESKNKRDLELYISNLKKGMEQFLNLGRDKFREKIKLSKYIVKSKFPY